MARIEATKAGAEALRKLSTDLRSSLSNLETNSNTLKSKISGLNGLGDFAPQITDIANEVTQAQAQGRDAVEQLCNKLNSLVSRIESYCSSL